MAKQSLLDKAKETPVRRTRLKAYTVEEIELVEAWINDEVTLSQLEQALGLKSGNGAYCFIALVCRQMLGKKK